MRRLDGYLSTKAQRHFPKALIYEDDGQFILSRPGQDEISLGDGFSRATSALNALIRAERQEETPQ